MLVDTFGDVGHVPSITIGSDAQVIIAHTDNTDFDLRITKLQHMSWTQNGWES
jgi:hypothetical protein